MHMQHTVHETHILKIISFISSRVNHPEKIELQIMATANLHVNGFYKKFSKVTGRHPP